MKKIFTVLVMALAMSLAFTGCASKKANKGPSDGLIVAFSLRERQKYVKIQV